MLKDDEKLLRTLFHHLIEGLIFLQTKGISHLNLKLENICLGRDNNFKLGN